MTKNCLRLIRNQQGYTLKDLALKTGIPFQRIASLEKGEIKYRHDDLAKLEKVLKIKLFDNTDEDQEILDLFDDFINTLYNGYRDFSYFERFITIVETNHIRSKFLYYLPLINYVINEISNSKYLEDNVSKYISDDPHANCLYLIYKANENPTKNYDKSLNLLNKALALSTDYRLTALARYELCFIYVRNYRLLNAINCIKLAKIDFVKGNSYIRSYNCDMLMSMALSSYGENQKAIGVAEKCLDSVKKLNLPQYHKARLYRNIAIFNIYNHNFEEALNKLDLSKEIDENNLLLIMYYIYAYSLSKQYDKADHWLFKAQMKFTDKDMLLELDFWKSYVKNKNDIPNDKLFIKSRRIIDKFIKDKFYEGYFFYSDILCSLYERAKDFENAYYLKKDRDFLLNNLKNS